jgi:hypothetical protein
VTVSRFLADHSADERSDIHLISRQPNFFCHRKGEPPSKDDYFRILTASGKTTTLSIVLLYIFSDSFVHMLERH